MIVAKFFSLFHTFFCYDEKEKFLEVHFAVKS